MEKWENVMCLHARIENVSLVVCMAYFFVIPRKNLYYGYDGIGLCFWMELWFSTMIKMFILVFIYKFIAEINLIFETFFFYGHKKLFKAWIWVISFPKWFSPWKSFTFIGLSTILGYYMIEIKLVTIRWRQIQFT